MSLRFRRGSLVLLCSTMACTIAPGRKDGSTPLAVMEPEMLPATPAPELPLVDLEPGRPFAAREPGLAFAALEPMPDTYRDPVDPFASSAPLRLGDDDRKSYTMAKLGLFAPEGDIEVLDDGYALEVAFGHKLLPFLALEGSLGYLRAERDNFDLWAIPLFVNARGSLPVLILEPYIGVGLGGMWVDYSAGSFDDSDLVGAAQAFLGVGVGLGKLQVGAEYKYLKTQDTKDNFAVEGSVISLFVMLPF